MDHTIDHHQGEFLVYNIMLHLSGTYKFHDSKLQERATSIHILYTEPPPLENYEWGTIPLTLLTQLCAFGLSVLL